ncbi:anthranilate synthase component I family protein [Prochlorococcus sp. MIT 1307]|uniref:anthranilate synthase component I family protein n=1 Tax=Prochlorococcus sp. MIT 1307 TaxID=3096219 RepID=UPI002A765C01|nr:anthranilate synthase component I family protein [Prochlorococcus sp. MIT 1307]
MIIPKRQQYRWQPPELLAQKLINQWGEAGFIWLDGDGSQMGRWITLAANPIAQATCHGIPGDKKAVNPFEVLRNLTPGHWTGWLGYEAGAWIEPCNPWKSDEMATLWIASHDPILRFDVHKQQLWLEGHNKDRYQKFATWLEQVSMHQEDAKESQIKELYGIPIDAWIWLTKEDEYSRNVNLIKDLIARGDIFQANLTACCTTSLTKKINAIDLFQRLRKKSPSPFGGVVIGAGAARNEAIISSSPERFLKVEPTGKVETRPIKGTRPRHSERNKDAAMAMELVCSPKDRAENVMIVDLLRNDLGRVCKPGSICVPQLVGLESYSQVHHLTSVIHGDLEPNKTWIDLIEAAWPGGSISGAPKLRACQRLHELEPTARGPYCGSILHIDWDGTFDSNILIRSIMMKNKTLRANAGCGIVADSDPIDESQELKWKLMPLLEALQ